MKSLRKSVLFYLLIAGTLLLYAGCATQRQVKEIVALSNAAMIAPVIDKAGGEPNDGYQESVSKIDQLIAAYPNQETLVNHLQLRAAMVLTVNQQDSLAKQRWEKVKKDALVSERDKALYSVYKTLVWWYYRAPDPAPLAGNEVTDARKGIDDIDKELASNKLKTRDIIIFLGTIRAQMALKLSNGASVDTFEQRKSAAHALADDLKSYVDLFAEDDIKWVQANKTNVRNAEDLILSALRNRIWLRDLVVEFKLTAEALLFKRTAEGEPVTDDQGNVILDPEPDWQPDWIKDY